MPKPLFLLIWYQIRGGWHQGISRLKQPQHALYTVLGMFFLLTMLYVPWMGLRLIEDASNRQAGSMVNGAYYKLDPAVIETCASMFFLIRLIWSVVKPGGISFLRFAPSEIDFLFPGPFARRELVRYRIVCDLLVLPTAALWPAAWLFPFSTNWFAAYFGILFATMFIYFLRVTFAFVRLIALEKFEARFVRFAVTAIVGLFVLGVLSSFPRGHNWIECCRLFKDSVAGSVVSGIFAIFTRLMIAHAWFPDVVVWASLSILINVALFGAILALSAAYETAVRVGNQKVCDVFENSGHLIPSPPKLPRSALWRPRIFGYWGGAGPIFWRQLITGFRSVKREPWGLCLWLLGILLSVSLSIFAIKLDANSHPLFLRYGPFVFGLYFVSICGIAGFAFDFRTDLQHMEWLKEMPVRPTGIVTGELLIPWCISTGGALVLVACTSASAPGVSLPLLGVMTLVPPLNLLLVAFENLAILIFPPSRATVGFRDQVRTGVIAMIKYGVLLVVIGVASGVAFLFCVLAGRSWVVFDVTLLTLLTAGAITLVVLCGWAFRNFDPSQQTRFEH